MGGFRPPAGVTACSDKGKTAGEPSASAAPAGTAQKRVVRLAMSGDYAPISTLNEKSQLVGFERDLLTAVGAAEGFTVETNRYLMPMWEAELFGAKSDVLSLTFGVPPEAREKMALSRPILKSRLVVGMLDKGQQWNVADLRGKTISVNKLDGRKRSNWRKS
uniref:Transporter substrate-binding domain-containing protein n=1 Tax=Conchiformibius kuhniae TaxID=211502 RepID=A0A8T9MVK8_9NEIS|nr:transporter substrate-binding domain-containing protein [Conchiformibius kuhniae]